MTGLAAYQNSNLNQFFTITPRDVLNVSPFLGLKIGDSVKVLDIFNAMLVGSCNDAAKTLADYVAKTTGLNFVDLMNNQAKILKMGDTRFSNPMGFDSRNNFSTAEDLKKLILAVQKFSVFNDLGRRTGYEFVSGSQVSYKTLTTNKLILTHPDIAAIKTGYTNEAHGSMAAKFDYAQHQIVTLVLDSQNREADTLKLKSIIEQGFQ
jgi:D-alanyl-D-alanine carboxypeptidase